MLVIWDLNCCRRQPNLEEGMEHIVNEIEEIINILKDTDIYEFKWENSKRKIFLCKSVDSKTAVEQIEIKPVYNDPNEKPIQIEPVQIKSSMVGTFYSGPIGSGKSFVTKNSSIKKGQVIGIIEAMKVIKEIQSEIEGEIIDIYVGNGQPIEYGQFLFGVIPQKKIV